MTNNEPQIRRLRFDAITAASYNPRKIEESALRGLQESLEKFGLLEMPVVNDRGGELRLVSGHQRIRAMRAQGIEEADCLVVQLDDLDEKIANLTMNNTAIRGTFDVKKTVESLPDLSLDLPRPDFAAFDAIIEDLRLKAERAAPATGAKAKEATDKAEKKVRSKINVVYELGKHRLYCGDFAEGLAKMCGKKRARACVTDPPYNVGYAAAWNSNADKLEAFCEKKGIRIPDSIQNDAMTDEQWAAFIARVSKIVLRYTSGPSALFMSLKESPALRRAWTEAGGAIDRWMFWVKDRLPFGLALLGQRGYVHQLEPILLGHAAGKPFEVKTGCSNILECPKPRANELHPTQKPLALIRTLVEQLTEVGDLVIDPFSGSGTTIAVAEETGRVCYACELDPRFVDVARKRWAEQVHGEGCNWVKLTPGS